MQKILIVCGPTATGKTKLGIKLAKEFDGEIVSADSRQVYRGMNVGTGKDLPVNSKFEIQNSKLQCKDKKFRIGFYKVDEVPIWLLDVVEPNYRFNVADYDKCAKVVLSEIWRRRKLPILAGGTGFYIKAVVDGIETIGIEPDWQLRKRLGTQDIETLGKELKRLDIKRWRQMNESDKKNPRRLIRAIEIAQNFCFQMSRVKTMVKNLNLDSLFIGLTTSNKTLYEIIDQRVDERVREGIEKEIRGLLERGYNWENSVLGTTISYKEWRPYFEGKMTKEEVIKKWKFDEHNYARRQMTWFKQDPRINWFDIIEKDWLIKVEKLVENWYIKGNSKFKVQN